MKLKKLSEITHQRLLGRPSTPWTRRAISQAEANWRQQGLENAEDTTEVIDLPLPSWLGTWKEAGKDAVAAYGQKHIDRLEVLANIDLPKLPSSFPTSSGWWQNTKTNWQRCQPPSDRSLVLDFEAVFFDDRWYPVCAVAISLDCFYVWVADLENPVTVVDFGLNNTVVGHNVGYDRQYLAPEYLMQDSGNRYYDTMASFIVCRGISNQQRPVFLKQDAFKPAWTTEASTNGLDAVYQFYTGKELDKGVRDSIKRSGMPFVRQSLKEVVQYCAKDVIATLEVFQYVYPENRQHRPSGASLTSQLLLGSCWLPLSSSRFPEYYQKAEAEYQKNIAAIEVSLKTRIAEVEQHWETYGLPDALEALTLPMKDQKDALASTIAKYHKTISPQLALLDWTPALTGKNKGVPKWLRDVATKGLSLRHRITALVLGVHWRSEPVLWHDDLGWYTETYGQVPHPDEQGKRCTDLFIKGFAPAVESGLLTASGNVKEMLTLAMSCVNWESLKKRVASIHTEAPEGYPVTLPQLVVTGTITGRCADNIWQVASNPKKLRIGTELKTMVEVPADYRIVGADVDSQELWIASALGDMELGYCGSTSLGLSVVLGKKEDKTDPHSAVALQQGIPRDLCKNEIYGALYGQGQKGNTDLLLRALPEKSASECEKLAKDFLTIFKGQKSRNTGRYLGGLASDAFNVMETIADSRQPTTPVLKAKLSKALAGIKDFKPTRVNWVIQSSGVDFRDLLVLYVRYLFDRLGIRGRLLMTIHDEIRTLVHKEDIMLATYALQIAHLLTRAAFIDQLDLDCIPAGVAWFSEVDVDWVLRKNPADPCLTPSQKEPLAPGITIRPKDLLTASWSVSFVA